MRPFARLLLVGIVALAASIAPGAVSHAAPPLPKDTSAFRGVNWADPRDNYADDEVVPSGLHVGDDYATTYRLATGIIGEFRTELRANTVRLPINPSSVGTDWWSSYQGAIDAATDSGFKVILSYWEADSAKDGRVDDLAAWNDMWNTVVDEYRKNPKVYFEPMNEPFGYSLTDWVSLTSTWLGDHAEVPRSRVVISGSGYNDHVTGVCAAPELEGTLVSLHFYGFWASHTTEADWLANLTPRVEGCESRTIIDEAGSPMTIGLNYGNHEGNVSTAFLGALTEYAREHKMGIVYWPGLRTGDSYSMTTLVGETDLVVNSPSGLAQLQWGWGLLKNEPTNDLPPAPPGDPLIAVQSGLCLDVPGQSTTPGTALGLWYCNGGANQSWNVTETGTITVYGTQCLTAESLTPGAAAIIDTCADAADQLWTMGESGTISVVADPTLCLTADGNVRVEVCTGADNQRWTRS